MTDKRRQALVDSIAESLAVLDGCLSELLLTLPRGERLAVAALRGHLLGAGVTEETAARCLKVLRLILADDQAAPGERLAHRRAFACAFCQAEPRPADLVYGESASICSTCALLAASGALPDGSGRGDGRCGFCMTGVTELPGDLYSDAGGATLICDDCVHLALSIVADRRRPRR